MHSGSPIKLIAFDADDTLWCCEKFFREAERRFAALFSVPAAESVAAYRRIAQKNLPVRGYGIKSSLTAMLEYAQQAGCGTGEITAQILEINNTLAAHSVELLEDAEEVVSELAKRYPLIIITKGDTAEQERKFRLSGLKKYFSAMEVFAEKTPENYRKLLAVRNIAPRDFLMIGDSLSGDIAPVKELGGKAIFLQGTKHWQPDICSFAPDAEITALQELLSIIR